MMKTPQTVTSLRSVMISTLLVGLILSLSANTYAEGNVVMRGALVTEPCVIAPGDETIELDFGSIVDKYLYLNQRTHGQEFKLHLSECDMSLGDTVDIIFSGIESIKLPGLLAVNNDSTATGIAIGFETLDGKSLPLNKAVGNYILHEGENVISLKAFVKGEPSALNARTIKKGAFNARTFFVLEYH